MLKRVFIFGALLGLTGCGQMLGTGNSSFKVLSNGTFRAEAEDLESTENFEIEKREEASGGEVLESNGDGEAGSTFEGEDGEFTMIVETEIDGDKESRVEVLVNGEKVGEICAEDSDENEESEEKEDGDSFVIENPDSEKETLVIEDVELEKGDEISIRVEKEDGDKVEVDAITLIEEKEDRDENSENEDGDEINEEKEDGDLISEEEQVSGEEKEEI